MESGQPQIENPPDRSSAQPWYLRTARTLRIVSLVLGWAGIPLFAAVLLWSWFLYGNSKAAASSPAAVQVSATAVSPVDLKKEVDAAVDASIKRDEALLDKLLLLVGLYSTILSFLALATVIVSRQDAKEQLANLKENLENIRAQAEKDINKLKNQIRSEFPIVSELENRVLDLIPLLEAKYPEDENLNRPRTASWDLEVKQQDMLIDEAQILAVSVITLEPSSLIKLYLVLARSYLERFRTGDLTDDDAARAYLYAGRAIARDRSHAEAYRMRGLVAIARYDAAPAERKQTDEFQRLLKHAKQDFLQCKAIEPFNAGAFYNLALIGSYEGNLDEAIRVSEELLAASKEVSRKAKEKYFPDAYINLACFLADKAKISADPAERNSLYERIVRVCKEGKDYLAKEVKSSRAMKNFETSLARELMPDHDLDGLPPQIRPQLQTLL